MASKPQDKLSSEQYLAMERMAVTKSEFYNGEVFAMSGASFTHNLLQDALVSELDARLRGSNCQVCASDLRVKVSETGLFTYPDLSVVCGKPQFADASVDTLLNPTVIIEILSLATEAYDRGRKFQHYRTIPSLRDYVLISQVSMLVEAFTRTERDTWDLKTFSKPEDNLAIESVRVAIPLSVIYDRVTFEGV